MEALTTTPVAVRPTLVSMTKRAGALTEAEAEKVRGLLRELIAAAGSQSALSKKIKVSQQHISNALAGRGVGYALGRAAAHAAGVADFEGWLRGRSSSLLAPKLKGVRGFDEALVQARAMFRSIPAYAFDAVGELMGEQLPEHITPVALGMMASGWHEAASDEARTAAITAKAEREMNEEDGLFAAKK